MSETISWVKDWQQGLSAARNQNKSIFLDFFLPG